MGVWALVRAAKSEADAAIFLTAAFAGLPLDGDALSSRYRDALMRASRRGALRDTRARITTTFARTRRSPESSPSLSAGESRKR
jgi:hypothetical protein